MWDAIGKISGQPVSRLLGAKTSSLPVYFTYVWPGDPTQDHVPFKEQAAQALRLKNAGFKAMKVRVWRKNSADDAKACGEMLAAAGSGFRVMVDRTAAGPAFGTIPRDWLPHGRSRTPESIGSKNLSIAMISSVRPDWRARWRR